MMTRTLAIGSFTGRSKGRRFLVLAPDAAKRIAHLAERRVRARRFDHRRHQVRGGVRGGAKRDQGSFDPCAVALPPDFLQSRRLPLADATDLLTADLDGDGMSEIIGYGLSSISVQRFGALTR